MIQPKKTAWMCVMLAVVSGLAAAQGPPGGKMPPPQVTLAPAVVKTVPVSFEYVGVTEASKTVEIRARVAGFLESREFQDGAWIEKGTRLFTIDARPFKADREIAAAQVEQAQARQQLADQELKRVQSVRTPGAVAASDLDQRVSEAANASAALRLAKAQLDKAELNLDYTNVTAPLTGYIGKAQKEIGSYVDSGQNSLLAVMQQVDPLYVSFQVSESDYLSWKRDTKDGSLALPEGAKAPWVEITLLDGTAYPETGVLDFENANLNTQTGTVEMRATFNNADRLLKPGQFVKVHLKGWERPNALTVPQRAVGQSARGAYVYVVGADNKTEMRPITTGDWAEQDWIVLEGVKEGEQVVVEGLTKIRAGMIVSTGPPPGGPGGPDAPPGEGGAPVAPAAPSEASTK